MKDTERQTVVFVTYNLNTYSGAAIQALNLAMRLSQDLNLIIINISDYDVDKDSQEQKKEDVTIYNLRRSLFVFFKIAHYLVKHKPKIVHFHIFLLPAICLVFLLRMKIVVKTTMISDDDFQSIVSNTRFGFLKKHMITLIDKNICLSKYAVKVNAKFLPLRKIVLIPNAVDTRVSYGDLKKETNSFCTVGVVCSRKGILDSIKYFNEYFKSLDESKFYIVGPNSVEDNVPEFDQEYYTICKDYISKNNLQSQVIFVGKCDRKEVLEFYKKCKGLIFFSKKEGLPNVILEALACNCVPIVTSIDGVSKEIIENGIDGFVFTDPSKEKIDISEINKIVDSKKCMEKAKSKYGFDKIGEQYLALYDDLTNS